MKASHIHPIPFIIYIAIGLCSCIGYVSFAKKIFAPDEAITFARAVLLSHDGTIKKALFSPDDNVKKVLLGLISAEQEKIILAIFSLTDYDVCKALIQALERGVTVEVIADRNCSKTIWSKIKKLYEAGISIHICPADASSKLIMHDKFAVFYTNLNNKPILWTGSFNFTYSAAQWNQENVIVLQEEDLIQSFIKQFTIIKKRSVPFDPDKQYATNSDAHERYACA